MVISHIMGVGDEVCFDSYEVISHILMVLAIISHFLRVVCGDQSLIEGNVWKLPLLFCDD